MPFDTAWPSKVARHRRSVEPSFGVGVGRAALAAMIRIGRNPRSSSARARGGVNMGGNPLKQVDSNVKQSEPWPSTLW